ncbi:helix-turn-helix domain-containing protein [Cellulosilyticum sp. WCF-2]|uniref:helix-turn-helix domain-containing protein n=1 Tax=Cellulosilyticum sp. WCF-2 TaxID=2497860 RepID=UPI003FA4378E
MIFLNWVKLGERIKKSRENKGLLQSDIAKLLDVSPSFICQLESGKKKMSLDNLIKLGKILEIDILE